MSVPFQTFRNLPSEASNASLVQASRRRQPTERLAWRFARSVSERNRPAL